MVVVLNGSRVRIFRPFVEFAANKMAGGILLLVCTVAALIWANSPFGGTYTALWHTKLTVSLAEYGLSRDLHFWVNDGLMVVFFFLVGLEIKREVLVGELASVRQAALPIAAALGGVAVPAILYATLNGSGPGAAGWGIPMATDIAFALGAMAILGDRVPIGLKVFLTALAIVDDIVAVVVIAMFYTAQIAWMPIGIAALLIAVLVGANRMGVRHPFPYGVLGILLWMAVLHSGIHPTIAGVALAFTIPARTALRPDEFLEHGRALLDEFKRAAESDRNVMNDEHQQAAIQALESACERVEAPLQRMEASLHSWVTFFIMPVFALANAGVAVTGKWSDNLSQPVFLGVAFGLLIGKPIGIMFASWLAVRSGIAALPAEVGWPQIHGAAWLAGIGFTMALFVAGLAFAGEPLLTVAKLGILIASVCAGIIGSLLLVRAAE